jgi:ferredoxin
MNGISHIGEAKWHSDEIAEAEARRTRDDEVEGCVSACVHACKAAVYATMSVRGRLTGEEGATYHVPPKSSSSKESSEAT